MEFSRKKINRMRPFAQEISGYSATTVNIDKLTID